MDRTGPYAIPLDASWHAMVGDMGALVAVLAVAVGLQWSVIMAPDPRPLANRQCPAKTERIRYPESLADFKDSQGAYRVAYCKPTGIVWARS